jgi:hypothetical protein
MDGEGKGSCMQKTAEEIYMTLPGYQAVGTYLPQIKSYWQGEM